MTDFIDITEDKKEDYNKVVDHPLQSHEWGEFRKKTGLKVIRRGLVRSGRIIEGFTLTLHKVPRTGFNIGYLPKGNEPTQELLDELVRIGRENNCIFIQLEPNLKSTDYSLQTTAKLRPAAHPLFTKYTFILDLTKSEQELLAAMHSKTRYNIRIAEKHKVKVSEDNSERSFEQYLKLMTETTYRQAFYAHTPSYHKALFETLCPKTKMINNKQSIPIESGSIINLNELSYHLLNAIYKPDSNDERRTTNELTLSSWVLFVFKNTLYYPYGASSRENRDVMANNLIAWEAIKFGKKFGLKYFDMWGALGPEPNKNDPWYGFHRFKEGYGAELVEFVGSYDLVIKPALYELYKVADKLRWVLLRLKSMIR